VLVRVNRHTIGYHLDVIPDDAAGRPLSPTELATIADLERQLLLDPAPVRGRAGGRRRAWYRSPNAAPLIGLAVAGVLLMVVAAVASGMLGAGTVLVSVVATAFAWSLLPPRLGGSVRLHRRRQWIARLFRPR
jgi:hypothetical protein